MSGEFCHFIFQYEKKRKWIFFNYSDHVRLNNALRKKESFAVLYNSEKKKKVRIELNKMKRVNFDSNEENEKDIRCIISNKDDYVNWAVNKNGWKSFPPRISFFLELAYLKTLPSIRIFLEKDYVIDLENFQQSDSETGKKYDIERKIITDSPPDESYFHFMGISGECSEMLYQMSEQNLTILQAVIFGTMPVDVKADVCTNISPSQNMMLEKKFSQLEAGDSNEEKIEFVPADDLFPDAKRFYVYSENNTAYKVTLHKSDVLRNLNDFYVLQLLQEHKKENFILWSRNGRIGSKGAPQSIEFGSNRSEAKKSFEKKFFELTSNHWSSIENFKKMEGKFDVVRTNVMSDITSKPKEQSILPKTLLSLLKLIANKDMLQEAAKELLLDTNVMRLSSITAEQIKEGYRALDKLTKVILDKGTGKQIVEACNDFYTKIPHCFNTKQVPLILTINDVKEKLRMLEALSNISLALNMIDSSRSSLHQLDKCYADLKCRIEPLSPSSREFKALKKCLVSTRGPTHNRSFELVEAFALTKDSPFKNVGNNVLLFHGSRLTNWVGILKNGLLIAPPEAPTTGYMFGKGIYFSDVSTKSCFYCFPTKKQNHGLILLCEVSLGSSYKAYKSESVTTIAKQYNSVHAVGQHAPTGFKQSILSSDAKIPYGPVEPVELSRQPELLYNEYIIYNIDQVKMKFLMRLKFEI